MGYRVPPTKRGYDFYEVASAMQKALRRGDAKAAGYWAIELLESGFHHYAWKRIMTVSAEDCWGILTQEVLALFDGFQIVNAGVKRGDKVKGRIFMAKAVILVAMAKKSRDADHLTNYVYDKKLYSDEAIEKMLDEARAGVKDIPEYAFDVHTKKGKRMGKTKRQFFKEEHDALKPKQKGLFDDVLTEPE